MKISQLKLRTIGNSVFAIIPKVVLSRLKVGAGDRLQLCETDAGYLISAPPARPAKMPNSARTFVTTSKATLKSIETGKPKTASSTLAQSLPAAPTFEEALRIERELKSDVQELEKSGRFSLFRDLYGLAQVCSFYKKLLQDISDPPLSTNLKRGLTQSGMEAMKILEWPIGFLTGNAHQCLE